MKEGFGTFYEYYIKLVMQGYVCFCCAIAIVITMYFIAFL
jgi:hypothetical protein